MLLSTWFFWAGVLSNVLGTQRGSFITFIQLLDFTWCTSNTMETQSPFIGTPINLWNASTSPIFSCVEGVLQDNGQNTNISSVPHYFSTASLISSVDVDNNPVQYRSQLTTRDASGYCGRHSRLVASNSALPVQQESEVPRCDIHSRHFRSAHRSLL